MITANRILALLVLVVIVVIPARWGLSQMHSMDADAASATSQAQSLTQQANSARTASTNKSSLDDRLKRYQDAIPADSDVVSIINQLSTAAASSGVSWTAGSPSVTPAVAGQSTSVHQYSLQATLVGTPDHLATFLDSVRTLSRLVVVDSVNVQGTTATTTAAVSFRFFSTGASS